MTITPAIARFMRRTCIGRAWLPMVVASGRVLRPYAGIAEMIEHDLNLMAFPQRPS